MKLTKGLNCSSPAFLRCHTTVCYSQVALHLQDGLKPTKQASVALKLRQTQLAKSVGTNLLKMQKQLAIRK